MNLCLVASIILVTFLQIEAAIDSPQLTEAVSSRECVLQKDPETSLASSLKTALERGCKSIRIPSVEWQLNETIILENISSPVSIYGDTVSPVIRGRSPLILIRRAKNLNLENLTLEGNIEMDQTENITFRNILFDRGGLLLTGKKCNQPNECTSFNRGIRVEGCTFENCVRGIRAERLEDSVIQNNTFKGNPVTCSPETVGIDLDGSSEDLDRPLELGHNKGNLIVQNSFEQDSSIGIRVRDSWANTIRDNHFKRSYRAMEFYKGARHNQVLQSYISYLSQRGIAR
ncbi:hypothetical protein L0222_32555 [bacterium]|nr:hypothetical protein [bacterium]